MRYCNLHQHSTFSDGKNSPEEIVLSAISNDMESIGFSDHARTPFEAFRGVTNKNKCTYSTIINNLNEKYKDKIHIFKGVEIDFYSNIETTDFDYVIGSVHYLFKNGVYLPIDFSKELQICAIRDFYNDTPLLYVKDYYKTVVECINKFKPDIIGHFDLLTKFYLFDEDDPSYQKIALDALEKCLSVTPILELNTGAISRGYKKEPYPAPFILQHALNKGAKIILSSDSHSSQSVICHFDQSVNLLKQVGFKSIVKLTKNGFTEVVI